MVTREQLENEPYIDNIPFDGRVIYGTVYYDDLNKKFKENTLGFDIKGFYKKTYWSKKIVDSRMDIELELINLLINKYSFNEIINLCSSVEQDIFNFGAIIEKQYILWNFYQLNDSKDDLSDVYMTELEYLMGLIRSFYDLIFDIYKCLRKIYKPSLPKLPKTLGKVSAKINNEGFDGTKEKYQIEEPFLDFLKEIMSLFQICKKIRDDIYHRGKYPKSLVFHTEKGPAVSFNKPFSPGEYNPFYFLKDHVINDENFKNSLLQNEVGSFFYFINKLIKLTMDSAESFANAIKDIFPSENISTGYKVFLRGPTIVYINEIPNNLKRCWMTP